MALIGADLPHSDRLRTPFSAAVGIASAAAAISWLASLAMVTGALATIWAGGFALYAAGGAMLPVVTPTFALSLAAGLTGAFRRRRHGE